MMNKVVQMENLFKVTLGDEKFSIVHAADRKDAEIIAGALWGNNVELVKEATVGDVNAYRHEGCRISYVQ